MIKLFELKNILPSTLPRYDSLFIVLFIFVSSFVLQLLSGYLINDLHLYYTIVIYCSNLYY